MQIASMSEWANAASTSADGNGTFLSRQFKDSSQCLILALVYTIQFWTNGVIKQKYYETADAIGKKLEVVGILAEVEKKVPPFHGSEEDDRTRHWVNIKAILALEAGGPAVEGLPTMPPPISGGESPRQTLPTRPKPPPASRGESSGQTRSDLIPRYHPM